MKRIYSLALLCGLFAVANATAADPKPEDLIGKWELTEEAAGMPKGTIFDFQKGGKLVVTVEVNKEKRSVDFGYSLNKEVLKLTLPDKTTDTTEVKTLNKDELVCRDANGTTAKFKRVKPPEPQAADLLGKWELTEAVAGMPKGTVWDFQKAGKLVVSVNVNGEKRFVEFGYEFSKKTLKIILPDKSSDTTELKSLENDELIFRDNNGTTAKFKRVK
jgi:uncharacterized protein (TIGR03066 family)